MIKKQSIFNAIVLFLFLTLCVVYTTATLHASMNVAQDKTHNWLSGVHICSEEAQCTKETKFLFEYDANHYNMEDNIDGTPGPKFIGGSFNLTVYLNSTREIIHETKDVKLTFPKGSTSWLGSVECFGEQVIHEPIYFIIQFNREWKNADVQLTSATARWGDAKYTTDIYDTTPILTKYKGSTPTALFVLGPIDHPDDDIPPFTPFDNFVQLDFDLSWQLWDELTFDQITIYPTGFGYLSYNEYEYTCLISGQYLTQIEIVTDPNDESYSFIRFSGVKSILKRNNAEFNGPNQVQIQCRFSLPPKSEIYTQTQHIGYVVELHTNEYNHLQNPIFWFASHDSHSTFPLTVYTIPIYSYIDSIGNSPGLALQARFNQIVPSNNKKIAQEQQLTKDKDIFMSYYFVSYPYEMPISVHAQQYLVNNLKHFQSMTVLITGQEMYKVSSLEYVHFFIRCNRQSMTHFNIFHTTTVTYGKYDVKSRVASGPGENQISITSPKIMKNDQFQWPSEEEFEQKQCDSWSFDLQIAVYNENLPVEVVTNHSSNAFAVRLRHNLLNSTALLRHDWVSVYDYSQFADLGVQNSNQFQIINLKEVKQKDNKQIPRYYTFDMIVDTTGIKKTEEDYEDSLGFTLQPIGGHFQFLLPIDSSSGEDILTEPVQCNISYLKDGSPVQTALNASMMSSINLPFTVMEPPLDIGLPYDTANITVSCPAIKIIPIMKDDPLNEYETNISMQLHRNTFVASIFNKPYSPSHSGRSAAAKFGIFILVVLLLAFSIALILFVIDFFTGGKVVAYWHNNLSPCLRGLCCCSLPSFGRSRSSSSDSSSDDQQESVGTYGSYQNSSLN